MLNEDGTESPYTGGDIDDVYLSWGLNYTEIVAPLVKVVQEQQKEIEELKTMISLL